MNDCFVSGEELPLLFNVARELLVDDDGVGAFGVFEVGVPSRGCFFLPKKKAMI